MCYRRLRSTPQDIGGLPTAELADFDLTIKYRPGRENGDADGLLRMPCDIETIRLCSEEMSSPLVQTMVQASEWNVSHTVWCVLATGCAVTDGDLPIPLSRTAIDRKSVV